MFSEMINESV